MSWSTSELAELAGTTVNAVRHYHRSGLLDEPTRASNGYKLYEVAHLVRLLRIKRLTDMGLPLAQIDALDDSTTRAEALRALDSHLAADIDRLVRVRAEVALVLSAQSATDLPTGFAADPGNLTDSDRSLMLIYSKLFGPNEMGVMQDLMTAEREPADNELDALPTDADDETR